MGKIRKIRGLAVATLLVVSLLVLPFIPNASTSAAPRVKAAGIPKLRNIVNQSSPYPNSYEGYVGDILKLNGSNLNQAGITVNFGSIPVAPISQTKSNILIEVPANATPGATYAVSVAVSTIMSITTENVTSNVLNFYIKPTPVVPPAPEPTPTPDPTPLPTPEPTPTPTPAPEPTPTPDPTPTPAPEPTPTPDPTPTPAPEPTPSPVAPELFTMTNLDGTDGHQGMVGDRLKLVGNSFDQTGIVVDFVSTADFESTTPATQVSKTASEIVINVPNVTQDQIYVVSVTNGTLTSASQLFYVALAAASGTPELWTITNMDGADNYQGKVGDRLKLTGKNFDQAGIVVEFFNLADFTSTQATPTSQTAGEIVINVPNVTKNQTYAVSVTNGNQISRSQTFYVQL